MPNEKNDDKIEGRSVRQYVLDDNGPHTPETPTLIPMSRTAKVLHFLERIIKFPLKASFHGDNPDAAFGMQDGMSAMADSAEAHNQQGAAVTIIPGIKSFLNFIRPSILLHNYLSHTHNRNADKSASVGLAFLTATVEYVAMALILAGLLTPAVMLLLGITTILTINVAARSIYYLGKVITANIKKETYTAQYADDVKKVKFFGTLTVLIGLSAAVLIAAVAMPVLFPSVAIATGVAFGIKVAAAALLSLDCVTRLINPAKRFYNWIANKFKPTQSVVVPINIQEESKQDSNIKIHGYQDVERDGIAQPLHEHDASFNTSQIIIAKYQDPKFDKLEHHHDDLIRRMDSLQLNPKHDYIDKEERLKSYDYNGYHFIGFRIDEERKRLEKSHNSNKQLKLDILDCIEKLIENATKGKNNGEALAKIQIKRPTLPNQVEAEEIKETVFNKEHRYKVLNDEREKDDGDLIIADNQNKVYLAVQVKSIPELLRFLHKHGFSNPVFQSFFSDVGGMQKIFLLADHYLKRTLFLKQTGVGKENLNQNLPDADHSDDEGEGESKSSHP